MGQNNLFAGGVGVLELPPSVDSVEARKIDSGYCIIFKTKAGEFVLHKLSKAKQVLVLKSLDSVKSRLAQMGWTGGFYVPN